MMNLQTNDNHRQSDLNNNLITFLFFQNKNNNDNNKFTKIQKKSNLNNLVSWIPSSVQILIKS